MVKCCKNKNSFDENIYSFNQNNFVFNQIYVQLYHLFWYQNIFLFNQNKFVFNKIYFHYNNFFLWYQNIFLFNQNKFVFTKKHFIICFFHISKIYFYYMNISLNTFLVSICGLPFVSTRVRILLSVCKLSNGTRMWKSC